MKGRHVSSTRAKIARADEHLETLYRETDRWGDRDPLRIDRQGKGDGRVHEFSLRYEIQPDVWRWALLLGDALHNLRSALDHIIYALAVNQSGTDPPDDDRILSFPITSDRQGFANAQPRIGSLNHATQIAIEKSQPYNRLKPGQWFMPLWWLAQLNNIDKHRLVHLTPIAVRPDDIRVDAESGTFKTEWNDSSLVDGTPFFRLTLTEPDPDVYVDLKATAAVVLNVKDHPPLGLHPTMQHIRSEVVLVCRYLSRCFQ